MKRKIILPMIWFLLLLSACGDGRKMAYGTVAEVQTGDSGEITAIVVEGDDGKQFGVLLTEETWTIPWSVEDSQIDTDTEFQAQLQPGTRIAVEQLPGRKELETAGGGKIRAHEAYYIRVTAILRRNAAQLADGTALDVLDHGGISGVTYLLPDGTELLWVQGPSGPENCYVANLESFNDLSETAQEKVSAYYQERGALFDEEAELEAAYAAWKTGGEDFQCRRIDQNASPSASGERVMYFLTTVMLPYYGGEEATSYELRLCDAFDRETGEHIDTRDLFTCPWERVVQAILDGDTTLSDPLRAEMAAALTPERVEFFPDNVSVNFEPDTLPSHTPGWGYSLSACISDLMHPWAAPKKQS